MTDCLSICLSVTAFVLSIYLSFCLLFLSNICLFYLSFVLYNICLSFLSFVCSISHLFVLYFIYHSVIHSDLIFCLFFLSFVQSIVHPVYRSTYTFFLNQNFQTIISKSKSTKLSNRQTKSTFKACLNIQKWVKWISLHLNYPFFPFLTFKL